MFSRWFSHQKIIQGLFGETQESHARFSEQIEVSPANSAPPFERRVREFKLCEVFLGVFVIFESIGPSLDAVSQ